MTSDERKEYNKKYREANKDKLKQYYENNKDRFSEINKTYYENNKSKLTEERRNYITCECGSHIQKCYKSSHRKSKKHQNYINSLVTKLKPNVVCVIEDFEFE
jgi:hypothetical protein